jgi:CTP:molybdopterin cytidylyltransferase MocA
MNGARVLLLAAGRGNRAGGPKAWKSYAGRTLLEAHVDFFSRLIGPEALSVAIQEEWRPRCFKLSRKTVWVDADPDAYPMDSLRRLIAGSPSARSFILHVDMPIFEDALYASLWKEQADAVAPVYDGRRGHPVLLSAAWLAELARPDPAYDRLDVFLRGRTVLEVSTDVVAIHRNMNEPWS